MKTGQALYEIDPRLYQAAVDQARANLASAQATQEAAKLLEDRYKPLAEIGSISKQDYTNAVASSRQATASIAQSQAALETAQINLKFTTVPGADFGADRPLSGYGRRARLGQPGRPSGSDTASGSYFRRHPAIEHGRPDAAQLARPRRHRCNPRRRPSATGGRP